ncbi:Bug family tripartite tricarboxylate transporter substrate binding protein [Zwartia panacis]|uniref:Bug family tripartite tricarboxylate transporter substrate binding protein n=1 Tax=Zwartia panacis TaxID=2683345 RepID=UPI0025B4B0B6|nr:tripartite tricarboxylate transporter substrate binding protein [Zwartia panacis]MDN4015529.1 tripartite tricarboxylate transporter substrate binding protein [Zwartia panacis]
MIRLIRTLLASTILLTNFVWAQSDYPSKAVTIVVPYAPGGTTDIVARILARALHGASGKSFVVENKGGASGTIAMGYVANAAPDGYTLLSNEMTQTVVPALFPKLTYSPVRDLTSIGIFAEAPYVLAISSKVPVNNLQEFVAYAKANPGKINFASGGSGSGPHMAGELLKSVAGIEMTHIPYKGSGPALQDLLSGQVEVLITAAPTVAQHLGSGRIKALAVASNKRVSSLPTVPTSTEAGLSAFVVANWFGLAAPKDTPVAIIQQLNKMLVQELAKQDFKDKLIAAGAEPVNISPAEANTFITAEAKRWQELIKKSSIKVEN